MFHAIWIDFCAMWGNSFWRERSSRHARATCKIFIFKYIYPVSEIGYELHNMMLITCIYRFTWQVTAVPNLRHGVTVHKMIYRVIYVAWIRPDTWSSWRSVLAWYNFCKSRAEAKWVGRLTSIQFSFPIYTTRSAA